MSYSPGHLHLSSPFKYALVLYRVRSQEAFETPTLHIFYEFADVIFSMLLWAMALIINVFRCCDAPAVCELWDRHLDSVYCSCTVDFRDRETKLQFYTMFMTAGYKTPSIKTPSSAAVHLGYKKGIQGCTPFINIYGDICIFLFSRIYCFKALSWFIFRIFTQVGSEQSLTVCGTKGKS